MKRLLRTLYLIGLVCLLSASTLASDGTDLPASDSTTTVQTESQSVALQSEQEPSEQTSPQAEADSKPTEKSWKRFIPHFGKSQKKNEDANPETATNPETTSEDTVNTDSEKSTTDSTASTDESTPDSTTPTQTEQTEKPSWWQKTKEKFHHRSEKTEEKKPEPEPEPKQGPPQFITNIVSCVMYVVFGVVFVVVIFVVLGASHGGDDNLIVNIWESLELCYLVTRVLHFIFECIYYTLWGIGYLIQSVCLCFYNAVVFCFNGRGASKPETIAPQEPQTTSEQTENPQNPSSEMESEEEPSEENKQE